MDITFDRFDGTVTIEHTIADVADNTNVTAVGVQRKQGTSDWETVYRKVVVDSTVSNQFYFRYVDTTARSRVVYVYRSVAWVDSEEAYGPTINQEVAFDANVLISVNGCLPFYMNTKYDYQKSFNVNYVQPYYSRYPHSILNGDTNYATGTFEGLINTFDENCSIAMKNGHDADGVVEFLSDRKPKILKTYDGHAWYIQINGNGLSVKPQEYDGLVLVSFQWTEIGEVPIALTV